MRVNDSAPLDRVNDSLTAAQDRWSQSCSLFLQGKSPDRAPSRERSMRRELKPPPPRRSAGRTRASSCSHQPAAPPARRPTQQERKERKDMMAAGLFASRARAEAAHLNGALLPGPAAPPKQPPVQPANPSSSKAPPVGQPHPPVQPARPSRCPAPPVGQPPPPEQPPVKPCGCSPRPELPSWTVDGSSSPPFKAKPQFPFPKPSPPLLAGTASKSVGTACRPLGGFPSVVGSQEPLPLMSGASSKAKAKAKTAKAAPCQVAAGEMSVHDIPSWVPGSIAWHLDAHRLGYYVNKNRKMLERLVPEAEGIWLKCEERFARLLGLR